MTSLARRFSFALALALSGTATEAFAEDLLVKAGESATLVGEHVYGKVTIEGTLVVGKFDGKDPNSGWLRIKANAITLAATGTIDATGRGFRGVLSGAEGSAMGAGSSPMPAAADDPTPLPGGGGAHIGPGGAGSMLATSGMPPKTTCTVVTAASGGKAYDDATMALVLTNPQQGMGSAGGTSHAGDPNKTVNIPGGNGGGVVMLQAATIDVLGAIQANGVGFDGPLQGASAGAGAGGTIYLWTNKLATGADTKLSATGGVGMVGNRIGGSGSGGLIVIAAKESPPLGQVSISGGAAANVACNGAKGADGTLYQTDPGPCLDVDGDQHPSVACGGDDCDDVDPNIHPGQPEVCDGIDQDCSGKADDADDSALCLKDETCSEGMCQPLPPDPTGPTDDSDPHLRLEGGLCSSVPGSTSVGWPLGAVLGLAATTLARRRARRP